MTPDTHVIGIVYATFASVAWTFFSFTMKMALNGAPVLKAAAAVNGMNALFVTGVAFYFVPVGDFLPRSASTAMYVALAGLLHIGLARSFFYTAIQRIGPNRSVPLALSYPVVTALLAGFVFGEPLSLKILLGLGVLIAGISLIVWAEPARRESDEPPSPYWRPVGWACAGVTSLLWGVAAIFFKKAGAELHPTAVSSLALWLGFACCLVFAGVKERREALPARSVRWLAASAALQTIAVPFYILAFTQTYAVRVTAIISAQPLIAIPIGWLMMREAENITFRLVVGAALVVCGTLLVII